MTGIHLRVTPEQQRQIARIIEARQATLRKHGAGAVKISVAALVLSLIQQEYERIGGEPEPAPSSATAPTLPPPPAGPAAAPEPPAEPPGVIVAPTESPEADEAAAEALRAMYHDALERGHTCGAIAHAIGWPHWKLSGFARGRRIGAGEARDLHLHLSSVLNP